MTYSIVARCSRTGQLGVAIATAVPAVGALATFASSKGAIASQAFVNPYLGLDGLHLLNQGQDAQTTLDRLIAADPGHAVRQVAIVDAQGRVAQFSGDSCNGWFGHKAGAGFGCQGNLLTGPEVVDAMAAAMESSAAEPLQDRLIAALTAGQAAGGDSRGRQSAAIRICAGQDYPWLDLRVDDHADPLVELRRLQAVAQAQFLPFVGALPTRENPLGTALSAETGEMLSRNPADR